ncbi:hypothetical protein D9757_007675 [Collybiopsis confluens]|uniref:DUF6533 domain-containing protein n=1 Tax=Collybiopsis confluens TaxID=2823264 RepID=A0A8H5M3I0_9AGAR|nr:hypothetical protein D9757_007675 [Collybiopsis confluens]
MRQSTVQVLATTTPEQVAAGFFAVNRSSVAALSILVYDILLTVNEEVEVIWPRPWSMMKACYYFVRYMPVLFQIPLLLVGSELSPRFHFTAHACLVWQVYQGAATASTTIAVDYILISRVNAFYFDSRIVRWIVGISYVLEMAVMAVGLGLALPGSQFDSICLVEDIPQSLLAYAIVVILFQTLLFFLTARKFILSLRSGWGRVPIVVLLMRDGTWAFLVLLGKHNALNSLGCRSLLACDASIYGFKNHAFAGLLYSWLLTVYSFCGYRVLLNIGHLTDTVEGSSWFPTRIVWFANHSATRSRRRADDGSEAFVLSSRVRSNGPFKPFKSLNVCLETDTPSQRWKPGGFAAPHVEIAAPIIVPLAPVPHKQRLSVSLQLLLPADCPRHPSNTCNSAEVAALVVVPPAPTPAAPQAEIATPDPSLYRTF